MSYIFILSDTSSTLSVDFNPPIYLDDGDYVIGLTSFETFNSIPNIDESNNKFRAISGKNINLTIPVGSYDIEDLNKWLQDALNQSGVALSIRANSSTLKTEIKCSKEIDFNIKNSVGKVLGFKNSKLKANTLHTSDYPANILQVNSLFVECNICTESYVNGEPRHVLHQFFPTVPSGFKIVESPDNVIYLPINVRTIHNITVKIVDQDQKLVNFRGEVITIGLHLKKIS